MSIGGQRLDLILKLFDEILRLHLVHLHQEFDGDLEIVAKLAEVHPPKATRADEVPTCLLWREARP